MTCIFEIKTEFILFLVKNDEINFGSEYACHLTISKF